MKGKREVIYSVWKYKEVAIYQYPTRKQSWYRKHKQPVTRHFLPSKLPPTLSNTPSLFQVLSQFPWDGVGQKVYQTQWGMKGFPDCYWGVARTKLKLEFLQGRLATSKTNARANVKPTRQSPMNSKVRIGFWRGFAQGMETAPQNSKGGFETFERRYSVLRDSVPMRLG